MRFSDEQPEVMFDFWRDNVICGIRLMIGDTELCNLRSDLVLDIDRIVVSQRRHVAAQAFTVAPATLTFHHISELRVSIEGGNASKLPAFPELSIGTITRYASNVGIDPSLFRWRIDLSCPANAFISFVANGYTLKLADPTGGDTQHRLAPDSPGGISQDRFATSSPGQTDRRHWKH